MKIILTKQEQAELEKIQRNVGSRSEYVKVTTILLLHKGLSIEKITEYLGVDQSTVYRYQSSYKADGIDQYLTTDYKGYIGRLTQEQVSELRQELRVNLYTDSRQVASWIQSRWSIKYSQSGTVELLHRIGFSYKQTKQVPCETNIEAQKEFIKELDELVEKARHGEIAIYFADGVHPTHNTRSTHAWIESGKEREQPTVSGRDRVNINGLLNALDPTDVIIVESESVNSESTQELYQKVLDANESETAIFIISDNARYYRNKKLTEWVKTTRIQPKFLPSYSPNLNLIERLWKFMRKKIINTSFYRKKEEFRQAVLGFFQNIEQYRDELLSLLTLNFHVRFSQSNL